MTADQGVDHVAEQVQAPAFARSVSFWAATTVGVAGLFVLVVGWFLGVDAVRSVVPGLSTMKANTATGFILVGLATNPAVRGRSRRTADLAAALLLALGVATMVQYLAGVDLGIDELLVADPGASAGSAPGRPGLNTAIGFVLLGAGSLLGDHRNGRAARVAAQTAAGITLGLSSLALLGYLLGVTAARGIGSATEMALHTAVLFVIGSLGLAAKTADVGLLTVLLNQADTGRFARVLLPTTVLALLAGVTMVEVLAAVGLLEDVRLQLALTTTVGLGVVAVAVLAASQRLGRAERRADEERAELDAVRAAFPDAHLRIGPDGVVLSVHGAAPRFGLDGVRPGSTFPEVEDPRVATRLQEALAACRDEGRLVGTSYATEVDGRVAAFEARFVPFGDGDVALAVRDVSHLETARRELERVNAELATLNDDLERVVAERTAELEQSNRDLERFAYLASHDLQEPLRMVTGFVSRIADRYGELLDERGQQYVHYAVDGAERMQQLIEGLLAYSRAGRLDEARVTRTDLADIVREVVAVTPVRRGARVETELESVEVDGDPVLLRQVVQNLVGNGLRFSRPGVPAAVRVGTRRDGDRGVVWVEDNGIGIPPEHRSEVFEMFRRFSNAPEHRGTGIGLSLVQQIVRAHGGSVEIDDAPDEGTRFTVTLPDRRHIDGGTPATGTGAARGGQPG